MDRPAHRTAVATLATVALALAACQAGPAADEPGPADAPRPTADAPGPSADVPGPTADAPASAAPRTAAPTSSPGAGPPGPEGEPAPAVEVVAEDLDVPWGLVVLPDSTALVGERDTAKVWRIGTEGGRELVGTVPGVRPGGEGGLLGLAVPPGGAEGELYAYATTEDDNRVLRLDLAGAAGGELSGEVVLDGIPKAGNHNGGRIAFGPDGYLYVTTGDASDGELSQDAGSLGGKVLRVTMDGEPAPGNPDPGSPVWSLGHRNVQGLDWDSRGRLWASEFGANTLDEVNLIEPGANYGWPFVEGPGGAPRFVDPVVSWPTADASPSGLAVGADDALYVAALRGESLWRVEVDDQGEAAEPERLLQGEHGRLRSVVLGPDDRLWLLTSNTFRGSPRPGDDRLLVVDPARLADR